MIHLLMTIPNRAAARFVPALALISALAAPALAAPPFSDSHADRIAEIAAMLPESPAGVGLPCAARSAWQEVAGRKAVLGRADRTLAQTLPEWRDADYLAFSERGDNVTGKRMMLAVHRDLTTLVDAECFRWDGRYLPRISETLIRLARQKSWVLPQNDRALTAFRGESPTVDLMTAAIASRMADALYRLGDRLPVEVRREAMAAIRQRAVRPVVAGLRGEGPLPWWMNSPSNLNAVCLGGIVGAALSVLPDIETRALLAAAAERYSDHYLQSFSADGYGYEGIGYWQYGFVSYARLRDQLLSSTQGGVDLFDNPQARQAALFPFRFAMGNRLYAAFGDADFQYAPRVWALDYVRHVFGLTAGEAEGRALRGHSEAEGLAQPVSGAGGGGEGIGPVSYFEDVGVLVVRPEQPGGLALTVKAGGNLRHSHNDVGSFAVGLGGTQPLGDPGGPAHYDGQSFGPQRYERPVESSFGHPVPVIDGQYQVDATTITPAVLARSSDPDRETITIDMTPAYDVPGLEAFHRTVEYHRGDGGRIVIRDKFDLSRPMRIVESFPTHGSWQQGSPRSVGFALDDARVALTFDGLAPQNIVADRVSQNGTRFEVLRAAFDLAGESVVEMSISPRAGAGQGN
jgi:hypothetical protein